MKNGTFALVLHSHLPYVLNHGIWPHGQDWLNEAAAETYIPLIRMFRKLEAEGQNKIVTINISPVLAEQLSSPVFKDGFNGYLQRAIDAAVDDETEFRAQGFAHRAYLASRWQGVFRDLKQEGQQQHRRQVEKV